jgi:NAD-dependent deacetylase
MKKKVVVFTGAGVSKESGISTFRDTDDGLWNNYKIEDVATPEGWKRDKDLVNQFYNERRAELPTVEPNEAHKMIAKLEENYDVINITQNVDDLLERAGCSNIIHLHGELTKAQSTLDPMDVYDIGYEPITDDKRGVNNSRLRPHVVWFGEMPLRVEEAYQHMMEADALIIIGTSFNISYTIDLVNIIKDTCKVYYIDPSPTPIIKKDLGRVAVSPNKATVGMKQLMEFHALV